MDVNREEDPGSLRSTLERINVSYSKTSYLCVNERDWSRRERPRDDREQR